MKTVIVQFFTEASPEDLKDEIVRSLAAKMGSRPSPWIPGAALKEMTGYSVDVAGIEASQQTHPGFTIICDKCGSLDVAVDISVGYSATSGAWGSVDLDCNHCHESVEIFQP